MTIQSRRDQVLAYRHLARRRHAALLTGDPDSPEAPLRKLSTAAFASVMAATLIAAGAGVLGTLSPGHSTSWRSPKVVILVKETGSRFIYDPAPAPPGSPPALHQILNYTSARLLLGESGWKTVTVSEKSLAGTPRAADIGIVGAPDDLPGADGVSSTPWTVCSVPGKDAANQAVTSTRLEIGSASAAAGAAASPLGDHGLLVRSPDGYWLVWHGHRYQIGDPAAAPGADTPARVLTFLGWDPEQAVPVSAAWLGSLDALAPLRAPDLAGGTPPAGATVNGRRTAVGQLVRVPAQSGVAERLFVVTVQGFAPVDALQYQLLGAATGLRPLDATAQDVAGAQADASTVASGGGQWPQTPPALADGLSGGAATACATTKADGSGVDVAVAAAGEGQGGTCYRLQPPSPATTFLADCVVMAPGTVAVVRSRTNTGVAGAVYLVNGNGEYTAKDSLGPDPATSLAALGYGGVAAAVVPQALLGLVPDGPVLSADLARQPVVPPGTGSSVAAVAGA